MIALYKSTSAHLAVCEIEAFPAEGRPYCSLFLPLCISDEKVEQKIQGNWVLENRDLFRSVQNSLSTELIFESYINPNIVQI